MTKKIKHQPINFAPTNTLHGHSSFFPKNRSKPKDSTKVIKYRVEFVKRFNNVTTTDLQLQRKYALNLICESIGIKKEFIKLTHKKKTEDILHTDRVYYVHQGKKLIGKCSIREQRTFTKTDLIFIYKSRHRISGRSGK